MWICGVAVHDDSRMLRAPHNNKTPPTTTSTTFRVLLSSLNKHPNTRHGTTIKKFSGQVKLIAWNWCLLARLTLPLLVVVVVLAQLAWLLCFVVPDSVTVTIVIAFGACACCFIEFASSWRMKRNGRENELFSISNHRHLHFALSVFILILSSWPWSERRVASSSEGVRETGEKW